MSNLWELFWTTVIAKKKLKTFSTSVLWNDIQIKSFKRVSVATQYSALCNYTPVIYEDEYLPLLTLSPILPCSLSHLTKPKRYGCNQPAVQCIFFLRLINLFFLHVHKTAKPTLCCMPCKTHTPQTGCWKCSANNSSSVMPGEFSFSKFPTESHYHHHHHLFFVQLAVFQILVFSQGRASFFTLFTIISVSRAPFTHSVSIAVQFFWFFSEVGVNSCWSKLKL